MVFQTFKTSLIALESMVVFGILLLLLALIVCIAFISRYVRYSNENLSVQSTQCIVHDVCEMNTSPQVLSSVRYSELRASSKQMDVSPCVMDMCFSVLLVNKNTS